MDLTRAAINKFLRPFSAVALMVIVAPSLAAQGMGAGGYLGPAIGSLGGGGVGTRSGKEVSLRFFGGVSGVYDNSLRPLLTDADGNLVRLDGLYGVEVSGGAYGSHNFKRSQLGLDYHGAYRRYNGNTFYNGTDQSLALKYTYQSSRRIILNLYESAGTIVYGNNGVAASATRTSNQGLDRSAVFFDNRFNFLQSTASLTWLQSAKTSFTMSGSGFLQNRSASVGLTNSWGYDVSGSVNRQVSRSHHVGGMYSFSHFEFPGFGMISDTNTYHATYASSFARAWTFALQAGVSVSEVNSPFNLTLNPVLAALLGQRTVTVISYRRNFIPSGSVRLQRQFQRAALSFGYTRGVMTGNGFSTTSRQSSATAGLSYSGLRKVSLSVDGGHYSMQALGLAIGAFSQYSAGAGASYNLGRATFLNIRYDYRDQQIAFNNNFALQGSRISVGLMFSPGNIPLSIW